MHLFELEFCMNLRPGAAWLHRMVALPFIFGGTSTLFSTVVAPACVHQQCRRVPFLHSLSSVCYWQTCYEEVVPPCSFDLHFSNNWWL